MRIALTGGTGLIGSALARRLRERNEIVQLGRGAQADIRVDLGSVEQVRGIGLSGIDVMIHAAGVVDEDFATQPVDAFVRSTVALDLLANRAADAGAKVMVYISTSHVYGPFEGEIDEDTCPNPLSDYAIAHYAAEQTLRRMSGRRGTSVCVLRPNAVFGTPLGWEQFRRWALVPFSFPRQAVTHGSIALRTTGRQQRNFISTDDLAGYVEAVVGHATPGFQVMNAVGARTMSVLDFAHACASTYQSLTGRDCKVSASERNETSGPEFVFRTRHHVYQARDPIEPFLRSTTAFLLSKAKSIP